MRIIMATTNKNKIREIRQMLQGSGIEVSSLGELGIDTDIEETGKTFEENAIIKARTISTLTGQTVIADDSGLVIDALDGAPGIYSARFLGEDTPYEVKCEKILEMLENVPDEKRTARFVCAMAVVYPKEAAGNVNEGCYADNADTDTCDECEIKVFTGIFEGRIAHEYRGTNGFGYDPVFYVPEAGITSAEMMPEEKNAVSHRGKALRMMVQELKSHYISS